MANEIHNYPLTATDINNCFFDVDQFNGVGYDSKKVPTSVMAEGIMYNNSKGCYYDITTQSALSANTPTAMKFANIGFEQGVQLVSGNKIKVLNAGTFNLQFSAQLSRTTGGSAQQISIWFRVNGTDVGFSNTHTSVQANAGKLVASWNYFFDLFANDEIQIMYSVSSTAIQLLHEVADVVVPHPATPSVIVTINKV